MKEFPQPTTQSILKTGAIVFFSTIAFVLLVMFLTLREEEGEFLKMITLISPIVIPFYMAVIGIPLLIVIILNKKRPDILKSFTNVKNGLDALINLKKYTMLAGIVLILIGILDLLSYYLKFISKFFELLSLNTGQSLPLIIIGILLILFSTYLKRIHIPNYRKKFEIEPENKKKKLKTFYCLT